MYVPVFLILCRSECKLCELSSLMRDQDWKDLFLTPSH